MAVKPHNEDIAGHDARRALELACRYLNRRERTVDEVRRYLTRHEVPELAIDEVIDTLIEQRYLDDERFARLFVEDKRRLEGWGRDRIRRGLGERGIDRELIAAACSADDGEDELDRALELLRRRFPAAPRTRRDRDRALGALIRKGYDSELALEALAHHTRVDEDEALAHRTRADDDELQ